MTVSNALWDTISILLGSQQEFGPALKCLFSNQWKIKSNSTNLNTKGYHSGQKDFLEILTLFQENLHWWKIGPKMSLVGILKMEN